MNGGHLIVCVDCGKPFEVPADALADVACCPFCGSDDPRGSDHDPDDGDRPEPTRSEPADFGGGDSTGVQDL